MQYEPLRRTIAENGAKTSLNDRIWFAKEAFAVSSKYDSAIFNYFDGNENPTALRVAIDSEKNYALWRESTSERILLRTP